MAHLRLARTAAWAGSVTGSAVDNLNDSRAKLSLAQELSHQAHRWGNTPEIGLVAGAELAESRLPIWRGSEAVLRALAIAGEQHLALTTVVGQLLTLVTPELTLRGRADEVEEVVRHNVPKKVFVIDEVVTRKHISIVLRYHAISAAPKRIVEIAGTASRSRGRRCRRPTQRKQGRPPCAAGTSTGPAPRN